MKKKVDFVFITLVYRNFEDLYDFCNSLKRNVVSSYEVVVVDAFYDEKTSAKISECSKELECHYLCTKNEERLHLSIIKQACFCLRFALSLQQKKEKQYKLLKP